MSATSLSKFFTFLILFLCSPFLFALELPKLISEHMVLQRGEAIPFWGWAKSQEKITVRFNGRTQTTQANSDGQWAVTFPKQKIGGPYQLEIEGDEQEYRFDDVWVGDVWVLSGQSNMEWPLRSADGAEKEITEINDSAIRHFKVPQSWASEPAEKLQGGTWQTASSETLGAFSAVGYFFAKRIREDVEVPIGLLNTTWGGSNIESWMDAPLLNLDIEKHRAELAAMEGKEEEIAEQVRAKVSAWPGALSDNYEHAAADWRADNLDESDWIDIEVPALWENRIFPGLDGVAWYRRNFQLTQAQAAQDLELGLARIDDHDITYVNGHKVGEEDVYNRVRRYVIPAKFLKEGKNTIAIRVLDTGGGGGIYSEANLLYLKGQGVDLPLAGTWKFKVDKGSVSLASNKNHTPTALYNKMLHPLFKIPVKGVLWYQGESNANNVEQAVNYRQQFPAMIRDWRNKWHQEKLPFYWVQLANFNSGTSANGEEPWAIIRESQTATLRLPHTGQAVIIDVGDPNDIHPRDKTTVGNRLALHALKNDYKQRGIQPYSPTFKKAKVKKGAVIVSFKAKGHLRASDGKRIQGFEIQGADGNWYSAAVDVKRKALVLRSAEVKSPKAIRYAWSDNPEHANLTDITSLPANPFQFIFQ